MHSKTKDELRSAEAEGSPSSLQIGDLEYIVGPMGTSEVVAGPPCVVAIIIIGVFANS